MQPALAQQGLQRTDLLKQDLSVLGGEAIQTRVDFAPGAVAPRHAHPGEQIVYREGKLPFPDGTIIARLAWNQAASEEDNAFLRPSRRAGIVPEARVQ